MKLRRLPHLANAWAAPAPDGGASVAVWRDATLSPVQVFWPGVIEVHLHHDGSPEGATAWRGEKMHHWRAGGRA